MKNKKHLSIVVASFLIGTIFVGCGSSSSTKKATLEDAPVDGVSYSCKNKFGTNVSEGKTDNNGTFYYKDRDNECEFKVGNLELGKVKMESTLVKDRVMPADLAGEKSNTEGKALLVAQILQSFDIDANASNGIEVNPKVAKLLSDTNISIKEIDSIDEVVTIIETKAQEKHEKVHIKVVDADEAIKHLVSPVGAETILDLNQNEDKGDETTTNTDNETVKYPQASKQQEAENTKDSNQQEANNLKDENQQEAENLKDDTQQEAQENRDSDQQEAENLKDENQQEAENLKDENQQEVENLKDDEQDSKDETKGSFIDTVKDDIKDMIGLEDNSSTTDDNQDSSSSNTQEDTNSSSNQEQTSDNNSTATTQDNTNNTTSTSEDNSTKTQTSNNQDSSNSSNSTKSSDSNGSNSINLPFVDIKI